MRILVLGGTTEASALAERLAARPCFYPLLSLAGRTRSPRTAPIPTRMGGFGGEVGLARFLKDERITAVIDATHPFAARISHNAARAAAEASVPILALRRPPWAPEPDDRWIEVSAMSDAMHALGDRPRRVFLTIGRTDLAYFEAAPQHHYLVRTIEPLGEAFSVPNLVALQDRGPFDEEGECDLMRSRAVTIVVTKNSGGRATYPKIAAARALGLPVVMVARPEAPVGIPEVATHEGALSWLEDLLEHAHGRAP
jgi:precorrin-6A/cobalt-precorrin-6A reductase